MANPRVCSNPNLGKLRKTKSGAALDFLHNVAVSFDDKDGCLVWPFWKKPTGYGFVQLNGRNTHAHRAVCVLAHGEPPTGKHHAAHSCHNRSCVNPHHLRWATPQENSDDKMTQGTVSRGTTHSCAKLDEKSVIEIRASKGKLTTQKTAEKYGISANHVRAIQRKEKWAWL